MKENSIGKALRLIGILTIVLGIIGSFILSVNVDSDFPITLIVGAVASIISGMCFIGFSEIIALLQESVNQQKAMIQKLQISARDNVENRKAPKTMLQDIESNLPQI